MTPTWSDALIVIVINPCLFIIIMIIIWVFFGQIYKILCRCKSFHYLMFHRVGTWEHPIPKAKGFSQAMYTAQLLVSLWTVGTFIALTYIRKVSGIMRQVRIAQGVWFFLHHMFTALRCEFNFGCFFTIENIVDFLTLPNMLKYLTVPIEGGTWISLDFFRSVTALGAATHLETLGITWFRGSEYGHELMRLVLKIMAFIICFGSAVFLLEVLGELPFFGQGWLLTTAMGDISIFTMFYWIVETISTVGYGDFAPKTFLSQIVTVTCMISGVAFFTIQLEAMMGMSAKLKRGGGTYKVTRRKHVVMFGGGIRHGDGTFLLGLLAELYCPSQKLAWPDLVIMTSVSSRIDFLRDLFETNLGAGVIKSITLLCGNPFKISDLRRCECEVASQVLIVANALPEGSLEHEDDENIMRALSLKSGFPETPFRLMLLSAKSLDKALSMGIRPQRCFAMNTMTSKLFWQSCRCDGWSAVISNLMISHDVDMLETKAKSGPSWVKNYVLGMQQELHGLLPAPEFHNKPCYEMVLKVFEEHGVCIVGIQVEGKVVISSQAFDQTISENTVCFAITNEAEQLSRIGTSRGWTKEFMRNRFAMFKKEDEEQGRYVFGKVSITGTGDHLEGGYAQVSSLAKSATTFWDGASQPLLSSPFFHSDSWKALGFKHLTDEAVKSSPRVVDMDRRAHDIKQMAAEKPFILVLSLSPSWELVGQFIRESRAKYLPETPPIIVLHPVEPADIDLQEIEHIGDANIAVVQGASNRVADLQKSGVKESSVIVCIGSPGDEVAREVMLDSDVIMLHRVLQRVVPEGKRIIFQFYRLQNMRFLPRHAQDFEEDIPDNEDMPLCGPRFASGGIFTPRPMASMLARAFYTPGTMEVILGMGAPEDSERGAFPWQIRLPTESHTMVYRDLFCKLVQDLHHFALPIGIFRQFEDGTGQKSDGGYVWTNPHPSTELKGSDTIYVLGPKEFGAWAHKEGLLLHSGACAL